MSNVVLRLLLITFVATGVAGSQPAIGQGACSRLADHADDVTDGGGGLYTDQSVSGRLDFTEAGFARSGDDLAIEVRIDDFNEPYLSGSLSSYWVWWSAPGGGAQVDIVDDGGLWSFSAFRQSETFGPDAVIDYVERDLEVVGSVDEAAGLISVLVKDILPPSPGNTLSNVVVGSANRAQVEKILGYSGDHIPNRNTMTTIDLGADCTGAPDPLRAWCRELNDPLDDAQGFPFAPVAPHGSPRVDLARVEFLPDGVDLTVRISVADLDSARTAPLNASHFWLIGSVSGREYSFDAYEIDGAWSATATLGDQDVPVSASADVGSNLITIEILGVLLADPARYMTVDIFSSEGIGAMTPLGPLYAPPWGSDFVFPPYEASSGVPRAVDLDAACPWPGT